MSRCHTSMSGCESKDKNINVIVGRSSMDYAQNVHELEKKLKGEVKTYNLSD